MAGAWNLFFNAHAWGFSHARPRDHTSRQLNSVRRLTDRRLLVVVGFGLIPQTGCAQRVDSTPWASEVLHSVCPATLKAKLSLDDPTLSVCPSMSSVAPGCRSMRLARA